MKSTEVTSPEALDAWQSPGTWDTAYFSVDSALLRELGERLVGRPHIALGELVKNAYDADATAVDLTVERDRIVVADDGHGMSPEEFTGFWMRIGSTHKERLGRSRGLHRPLTGSKGVGRLSVQFLASQLRLRTASDGDPTVELVAEVDWKSAVRVGDLTRASARYRLQPRTRTFPDGSAHGTALVLDDLNHRWSADDFRDLAREIWALRPPFRRNPSLLPADQRAFEVRLHSPDIAGVTAFLEQMDAVLSIWHARIVGRLIPGPLEGGRPTRATIRINVEFADGAKADWEQPIDKPMVGSLDFEVRVFHLRNRQPHGLKVEDVRAYFNRNGGVHVYDAGFHLPYYGPEADWLRIELDHAHRLSRSALLPSELQVPEGLNFLPTNSRLYGVVNVDTSREHTIWDPDDRDPGKQYLRIQISRDRLVDNEALRQVATIVRTAVDFYAMQEAGRVLRLVEIARPVEPVEIRISRFEETLGRVKPLIPSEDYAALTTEVRLLSESVSEQSERITRHAGLLGALATAGIVALAFEHEIGKQYTILADIAHRLESLHPEVANDRVQESLRQLATDVRDWISRASATRALFQPLLDEENRTNTRRFRASRFIDDLVRQMGILLRAIYVDTKLVPADLRLPAGTYAEWAAVFQNLFINSVNAMLDSTERRLRVTARTSGRRTELVIEDTGSGVDPAAGESLFEPFNRRMQLSPERQALGLGGTGLGLTIVRMILTQLRCEVHFAPPSPSFATAVSIQWTEGD